jgi:hypothetical protein
VVVVGDALTIFPIETSREPAGLHAYVPPEGVPFAVSCVEPPRLMIAMDVVRDTAGCVPETTQEHDEVLNEAVS